MSSDKLFFPISPDTAPEHLAGWLFFGAKLKRVVGEPMHIEEVESITQMQEIVRDGKADLIFASPFQISHLFRDHEFIPLARPKSLTYGAVILTHKNGAIKEVTDFQSSHTIAITDSPELQQLGMILLEPSGVKKEETQIIICNNPLAAVKKLINQECDLIIVTEAFYQDLSATVKRNLYQLVATNPNDVKGFSYALMLHPKQAQFKAPIQEYLACMHDTDKNTLEEMGLEGWSIFENEEEFDLIIRLVDTLSS